MRILVLGAAGMLGRDLLDAFAVAGHDTVATDVDTLDITERHEVHERFAEIAPDFVINCAAYTAVARAEQEGQEPIAHRINAEGPRNLAEVCSRNNTPLLHLSTDYVFDGSSPTGYREDATPRPINAYGRTKAAGEQAVQAHPSLYLVRTSWLYGRRGPNFVETMLRLGKERPTLNVVDDQVGSPTYTRDLAAACLSFVRDRPPWGIYHVTNDGSCSWYEFAVEIMHQAGLPCRVSPISTEQYGDPTPRPRNSILINTKLPRQRSWSEALSAYLAEPKEGDA